MPSINGLWGHLSFITVVIVAALQTIDPGKGHPRSLGQPGFSAHFLLGGLEFLPPFQLRLDIFLVHLILARLLRYPGGNRAVHGPLLHVLRLDLLSSSVLGLLFESRFDLVDSILQIVCVPLGEVLVPFLRLLRPLVVQVLHDFESFFVNIFPIGPGTTDVGILHLLTKTPLILSEGLHLGLLGLDSIGVTLGLAENLHDKRIFAGGLAPRRIFHSLPLLLFVRTDIILRTLLPCFGKVVLPHLLDDTVEEFLCIHGDGVGLLLSLFR
mmetsp:Transcript_22409/g.64344  ORF Transcript_22409/g.64344 Transcript_22409/m.64344 type:complete len:268 (-) Transcript_22409:149-952(-)